MKKNILIIALSVVFVVLFASCTTFTIENAAYGTFKGKELGNFEVSVDSFELIGMSAGSHLIGGKDWKGNKLIQDTVQAEIDKLGGSAAINVEVKETVSVIQALLCGVTQRIYAPESIVITGTVIK